MAIQSPSKPTRTHQWPPQGEWTYDDYAHLPDTGVRYEIIEGELHMSPAPRPKHQRLLVKLTGFLEAFVASNQLGEIYVSPVDVILPHLANPVQPDILFIAKERLNIVKETLIEGVPDLIVEIMSPGSVAHDRRTKFHLYARAGVREYWIVDAESCTIEVYTLRGHAYVPLGSFGPDDTAQSELLAGFRVAVRDVCAA